MATLRYQNFDLLLERSAEGFRARVLDSPAGRPSGTFTLPFTEPELADLLARIMESQPTSGRLSSPALEAARAFGQRLYNAVFGGEIGDCLKTSVDRAEEQNAGLRLRLHLTDAPELVELPWEYLYSPALKRFIGLSVETPLVRYLEQREAIRPLAVKPPLRVLALIASPKDLPPLDIERELANLNAALENLRQRDLVVVGPLLHPTAAALQQHLRRQDCHILHFVGHGGFDPASGDGMVMLEDEAGRSRMIKGTDLGTLLHDHRPLRLAVLNACEAARGSRAAPFAGTAQSLVQQGIPAVIAMQFNISDEAAIVFSREFYGALADNYPVDAALVEARKAISLLGTGVEWGTPVLYMRAADGRIFELAGVPQPRPAPEPAPTPEPTPVPQPPMRRPVAEMLQQANRLIAEADDTNRMQKFRQAYELLQQANRQEPTHIEVLLLMAQCLTVLTPEDQADEARILQQIQHLLATPRTSTERLQLAQVRFMLATTQQPPERNLLTEARNAFASLGQTDWVRRCDELLLQTASQPVPFNPIGRWQISGTDGNVWLATYNPDGTFYAQLVRSLYPMQMQYAGRWLFTPFNGMLQMQGLINGFQPHMSAIFIQGPSDQGYVGMGSDGTGCLLVRV